MSWGDMFPEERQAAVEAELARPVVAPVPEPPGFWDNITGGAGEVGRTFARAGTGLALAASTPLIALDKVAGTNTADPIFEFVRDYTEKAVDYWKPDYQAVGMAGQVLGGLTRMGTEAVMGGTLGIVANEQFNQSFDVAEAGGSTEAIVGSGVARGLTMAAMLRLPAAMGTTRLQSAGIGAVANAGLGVVDRAAQQAILQADDLDQLAEQYKPFDPTSLAIDSIFGAVAGGVLGRSRPEITKSITPEHRAAAQTLNLAEAQAEGRLLPRDPFDAEIASRMNDEAFARVRADGPMHVDPATPIDPARLSMARARVAQALADEGMQVDPVVLADPALDVARSLNTFSGQAAGAGKLVGMTQPPGTPIDKLFANFADQATDRTPEAISRLRGGMLARASLRTTVTKDAVQSTVPFGEGTAEVHAAPISGQTQITFKNAAGDIVAAARIERGMIDSVATAEAAKGQALGKQILLWVHDQGIANIREVPDRSPGFVRAQQAALTEIAERSARTPAADAGIAAQGDRPANASAEATAEVGQPDIAEIPKPVEAPDGEPSPAMIRADEIATSNPDLRVPVGADADGQTMYATAAELMAEVRADLEIAKRESTAFEAAANCMLGG